MISPTISKFLVVIICVSTAFIWTACASKNAKPDIAFIQWLTEHSYEFRGVLDDGMLQYQSPGDGDVVVNVQPYNVQTTFFLEPSDDFATAMLDATEVIIGAIESYNMDPKPLREAMSKPFQFPVMLQSDGYLVKMEEKYGLLRYGVTFRGK